MTPLRDLFTKLFKKKHEEPWLAYYSKEERKIKFTEKTIYEYLKECVALGIEYCEHLTLECRKLGIKDTFNL